ncbi:MAG: hypothetical protein K2H82_03540 [Oscillospiraceae bacterium]|nr:hypothetical protein [Oscillospiraceae bacterium]
MKYREYSDEELDRMEQATVPLMERNLAGIVFGYAYFNAGFAGIGTYDGFSIVLFDTGVVEVREYICPEILIDERLYSVPQSCILEIQQQYQKYHNEIQTMYAPYNGSCDGELNCFYFGNHWIDVLNIDYTDEKSIERIREVNPDPAEFEEILAIVREENKIMKLFFSICEILRKYAIILDLYSVTVHGESTMTDSEVYAYEKGILFWNVRIWCRKLFQKLGYFIRQLMKSREEKSVDKSKQK